MWILTMSGAAFDVERATSLHIKRNTETDQFELYAEPGTVLLHEAISHHSILAFRDLLISQLSTHQIDLSDSTPPDPYPYIADIWRTLKNKDTPPQQKVDAIRLLTDEYLAEVSGANQDLMQAIRQMVVLKDDDAPPL